MQISKTTALSEAAAAGSEALGAQSAPLRRVGLKEADCSPSFWEQSAFG